LKNIWSKIQEKIFGPKFRTLRSGVLLKLFFFKVEILGTSFETVLWHNKYHRIVPWLFKPTQELNFWAAEYIPNIFVTKVCFQESFQGGGEFKCA
jgi:hypothetical protein